MSVIQKVAIGIWAVVLLIWMLSSMMGSSGRSNGYSRQYNYDSEYRSGVNDVANMAGKSSREVDALIQMMANEAAK